MEKSKKEPQHQSNDNLKDITPVKNKTSSVLSSSNSVTPKGQWDQTQISTKPTVPTPDTWTGRCFTTLDSENRGFLYKSEILDHIRVAGVYTHHQLETLINALECKEPRDPIDFQEFEYLLHG